MNTYERIAPVSPNTIVAEWRREVKYNNIDEFWKGIEQDMKQILRGLIEKVMEEEVVVYTGAEWNKKSQERIDYRNGYYYRDLLSKYGGIKIRVPRLRKNRFRTKVFRNYQRRMEAVDRAIKDVFFLGGSINAADKRDAMLGA